MTIYTDAGYAWKKYLNQKEKIGIIGYKLGKKDYYFAKVHIQEIEGLKQYSNLLELSAVRFALEKASQDKKVKKIKLLTDSKIAKSWVDRKKNNLRQFSQKHFEQKKIIDQYKEKFGQFKCQWIPREQNKTGIELEERFGL